MLFKESVNACIDQKDNLTPFFYFPISSDSS